MGRLVPASPANVARAARILAAGGLVVFPTETVYGLGADSASEEAMAKVYAVKGRPGDKPLSLHLAQASQAAQLACQLPASFQRAAQVFWPGPLAAVLSRADGSTVSLRLPDHPAARALSAALGRPIAGTSANLSGQPSPVTATEVLAQLGGAIEMILDAGPCPVGIESSIVDFTSTPPVILRQGAISREKLEAVLGLTLG